VGGKLTTYRSLAEQTVDLILRTLGKNASQASTASAALPGAAVEDFKAFCERFKTESGLGEQTSKHLLRVYGSRAVEIEKLAAGDQSLREIFDDETGAIAAEVIYAFKEELAQTLGDCLLRRTMVGLNSSLGVGADEAAARIAQNHLGWSEERVRSEVSTYRQSIERFHTRSPV
jgi:glycerol-3-phosphate dehydrogenase